MHFLQGTSGRYCIGSTTDLEARLERHNSGMVYSTKRLGIPLRLVVPRNYGSVAEAREVEAMLKRSKNP